MGPRSGSKNHEAAPNATVSNVLGALQGSHRWVMAQMTDKTHGPICRSRLRVSLPIAWRTIALFSAGG